MAWQSRRNLFAAGFGFMGLVIAAAAYFVFRAVRRELGVAKLQSDFVSAVSHEFLTPLAAMCLMTEMLEENGGIQWRRSGPSDPATARRAAQGAVVCRRTAPT